MAYLPPNRLLKDGTAISVSLTAVIFGTLYLNPEIWVHDAPPDIREKFGSKSEKAKRQTLFVALPFFLILFGGVIRSNILLKRQNEGELPFKTAFLNAYGLFLYFWLFDLVILDWLIFVTIKPKFLIFPGTEGMAGYDDYGFHLKTALPALPLAILPAFFIAMLTANPKRS
ncbi:nitroreductase [Candidatus Leptofilum sp.]|uniref:nitroreductase n=1 Tax=Candidatus Leptofilum sp. TaxID=3241576 RepID=UPI003B5CD94D